MKAPTVALLHHLAQHDEPLAAPRLLLHEVANALLTGIRRGRWSGAEADASHRHLQRLPILLLDRVPHLAYVVAVEGAAGG